MDRKAAREQLINLGIEEPTDKQISDLLDTVSNETKGAKANADKLKEKADKSDELQRQLDALQSQGLSDLEKAQKELADAQGEIANLKASSFRSEAKGILKGANLDDSTIEALLGGLVASTLEETQARANAYVETINKVRESAIKGQKKTALDNTSTPNGGEGNTETKTEAEKVAESIVGSRTDAKKSADIMSNYL